MKHILFTFLLLANVSTVSACPFCSKENIEAIYNSTFYPNLLTMLSGFFVLAVVVAILAAMAARRHRAALAANPGITILTPVPLLTTSMILGIGLGGFIDGIVLHQILQWHEMLSNKIPPTTLIGKTVNMFWDGVFHAFCLVVVLIGVIRLWKLIRRPDIDRSGYLLSGGLFIGWGIFNIIEGLIDHHFLKLHNVKELSANPEAWNYGFLVISVVMIIGGYLLAKKRRDDHLRGSAD